jgi:hypothetical protein
MKKVLTGAAAFALFATMSAIDSSQAQTKYTDAVLNGCYGYLATSVDTQTGADNRNVIGTICFNGVGGIVGTPGSPALTGDYANTNGTLATATNVAGAYVVTNTPGDGMGTWQIAACATQAFSVNTVDANGLAHGFQFALIKKTQATKCAGPNVIGGTAYYQGPLNPAGN